MNMCETGEGKGAFCFVQARLNQPIVKETTVLAYLLKLLSVKRKIRGGMPSLYAVLRFTFLWWYVHNKYALDKVSI